MPIESEHRASDSPYIARVWRGRTTGETRMTSVASTSWELVFWEEGGTRHVALRGPETAASTAEISGDGESFGIAFAHGASMPHLPVARLVDDEIESPRVAGRSFELGGEEWEIPEPDDAEAFVRRLVRAGTLVRDPLVDEVVWGGIARVGSRSVQRRVAASTGLTQGSIRQIQRAREAAVLIADGAAPLDVAHRLGYYDQPHLARSLLRFIGRTATQLQATASGAAAGEPLRDGQQSALSLLYKPDGPSAS
ncbi:helix-turn-helix domain-containing protein [Agromyces archimandritae]|uniref:AraC family transcriptional regulator n=1 Tax=Agromyces archimandritae TaxID=2781962 RepID=A0A975IPR4_9MICO|nr:AraC family transcriptional regulator [Agromyces archimandritae]QTX05887.1 AraC family transcriptional regulator [Agromyces archimandritae]